MAIILYLYYYILQKVMTFSETFISDSLQHTYGFYVKKKQQSLNQHYAECVTRGHDHLIFTFNNYILFKF